MTNMGSVKLTLCLIATTPLSFATTCSITTQTNILSQNPEPLQIYLDTNYLEKNDTWLGDTGSPIYTLVSTNVSPNQLLKRVFRAYDSSGYQVAEITELVQLYNCKVLNATTVRTPGKIYYDIKPLQNTYEATYIIPNLSQATASSKPPENSNETTTTSNESENPPQQTDQDTTAPAEDEPETPSDEPSSELGW